MATIVADRTAQTNGEAPAPAPAQTRETPAQTPAPAPAQAPAPAPAPAGVRDQVREDRLVPGVGVPVDGRVVIHEGGPDGRVSHIIPAPRARDPNEPIGNRHFPGPPVGPEPWAILREGRAPPLFQRPAPQHPFRVGIAATQAERQRWRQAWYPYALNLIAIINRLIALEQARDDTDAAIVQAYVDAIVSINYDIQIVLEQNPDIMAIGGRQNAIPVTPTPHSYLASSERILRRHQTQLEGRLGDGVNEAWRVNAETPVRRYGEQFPEDAFREILHYRPQYLGASKWSEKTTMEKVMLWISVPVILFLSCFFGWHALRLLWNLIVFLWSLDYKETWSNFQRPTSSSWVELPGRVKTYVHDSFRTTVTTTTTVFPSSTGIHNANNLNSTSVQSAASSATSIISQFAGTTTSAGKIFAEEIVFKVAGTMRIGPKL